MHQIGSPDLSLYHIGSKVDGQNDMVWVFSAEVEIQGLGRWWLLADVEARLMQGIDRVLSSYPG